MTTLRIILFAISWTYFACWVINTRLGLLAGHQVFVALRGNWESWPASKKDIGPWPRSIGKCQLRFEVTSQILYPGSGSNQVGCFCTQQRSASLKANTSTTTDFPVSISRAYEFVINQLRIGHTKATRSHRLFRKTPTICLQCGQTLTVDHMLLKYSVREILRSTTQLIHWKLSTLSSRPK